MKIKTILPIIFISLFTASGIFAQEDSPDWINNCKSIGISIESYNVFYFLPGSVEFRNWKDKEKGYRILLERSKSYIGYGEQSDEEGLFLNITQIELVLLKRHLQEKIKRMSFYKGIGIDFSCYARILQDSKQSDIGLYLSFPCGVEHFFLESVPNISYSAEIDFQLGPSYSKYDKRLPDSLISLEFNINPLFFIHWYFK